MLTGGFYSLDAELLCREAYQGDFFLPLDVKGEYKRKIYTNNGRTASIYALQQVVDRMANKVILLPDYLCISILTAIEHVGIAYRFYRVNEKLEIDVEDLKAKATPDVGMIYVIHYFSVPQPAEAVNQVKKIAANQQIMILEDITQALFSIDEERMGFGDFLIASTRKWFPMTDGGMVAIRKGVEEKKISLLDAYNEAAYKELLISVIREHYSRHSELSCDGYLEFEKQANASRYVDLVIREMTEASKRIFFGSDKEVLIHKRRENYRALYECLKDNPHITCLRGPLESDSQYIPFGFVILTEKREDLYRYLVEHKVITEIQWLLPYDCYHPGEVASYLSKHNIMIHCDQRYGEQEMRYIAGLINTFSEYA